MYNNSNKTINKYRILINPFIFKIYLGEHLLNNYIENNAFRHNHCIFELHYFIEGNGVFEIENETFNVLPNSFFLIGPGVYHTQYNDPKNPASKYCFQFDYIINDDYTDMPPPWCIEIINLLSNLTYKFVKNGRKIFPLIEAIQIEYKKPSFLFKQKAYSILLDVMIEVFRLMIKRQSNQFPVKTNEHKKDYDLEVYFEENYRREDLTAERMSKTIGVSSRHLNRLLKKHFNMTFKQKLIETRIEIAKGLLVSTDFTIEKISEEVGFGTTAYFYKVFKQKSGITPGEYRRSHTYCL